MICVSHMISEKRYPYIRLPDTNGVYKMRRLHRLVYELHNGPIPDGMFVCHTCDNPQCCNPDHLFIGSPMDNSVDMVRKGRQAWQKLSVNDVQYIKSNPDSLSPRRLADMFGVSRRSVRDIHSGNTWKHVEPKQSNRTSHLSVPDDVDSINHQPHHTGREPRCGPVLLTNDYSL